MTQIDFNFPGHPLPTRSGPSSNPVNNGSKNLKSIYWINSATFGWKYNQFRSLELMINPQLTKNHRRETLPNSFLFNDEPWSHVLIGHRWDLTPSVTSLTGLGPGEGYFQFSEGAMILQSFTYKSQQSNSELGFSLSYDKDNQHSESIRWLQGTPDGKGFSTLRAKLEGKIVGDIPWARGLNIWASMSYSELEDLSDQSNLGLPQPNLDDYIDPVIYLKESQKGNVVRRNTFTSALSYRILDKFIFAYGFEFQTTNSKNPLFTSCSEITEDACLQPDDIRKYQRLGSNFVIGSHFDKAYFGIGFRRTQFNRKIQGMAFQKVDGEKNKKMQLISMRLYLKL